MWGHGFMPHSETSRDDKSTTKPKAASQPEAADQECPASCTSARHLVQALSTASTAKACGYFWIDHLARACVTMNVYSIQHETTVREEEDA